MLILLLGALLAEFWWQRRQLGYIFAQDMYWFCRCEFGNKQLDMRNRQKRNGQDRKRGPEEGGSNAYFRDRYKAITVECVKTQKQKDFAGECCAWAACRSRFSSHSSKTISSRQTYIDMLPSVSTIFNPEQGDPTIEYSIIEQTWARPKHSWAWKRGHVQLALHCHYGARQQATLSHPQAYTLAWPGSCMSYWQ